MGSKEWITLHLNKFNPEYYAFRYDSFLDFIFKMFELAEFVSQFFLHDILLLISEYFHLRP